MACADAQAYSDHQNSWSQGLEHPFHDFLRVILCDTAFVVINSGCYCGGARESTAELADSYASGPLADSAVYLRILHHPRKWSPNKLPRVALRLSFAWFAWNSLSQAG